MAQKETTTEGAVDVEFTSPVNALAMIDNPELVNSDKDNPVDEMKTGDGKTSKDASFQDVFNIPKNTFEDLPAEFAVAEEGEEEAKPEVKKEVVKEEVKPEEVKEEKKSEDVPVIAKEIQEVFPEAKTVAEVVEQISLIKSEIDEYKKSNDEVVDVLSKHPALTRILKDVKNGIPLYDSIRQHLEVKEDEVIPDPATQPNEYRAYVKAQVDKENKMRQEDVESAERQKKVEAAQKHAGEMRESFITTNKIQPEELSKFGEFVQKMTYGDPVTFQLPSNYLEIMWNAYKRDADVASAEKKGEVKGRNETIEKLITKQKVGDGLPALQSVSTKAKVIDAFTDLEESLERTKGDPITNLLNK